MDENELKGLSKNGRSIMKTGNIYFLYLGFFLSDAVGNEAAFHIIQNAEVFTSFLDANNICQGRN